MVPAMEVWEDQAMDLEAWEDLAMDQVQVWEDLDMDLAQVLDLEAWAVEWEDQALSRDNL